MSKEGTGEFYKMFDLKARHTYLKQKTVELEVT